MKNYFAIILYFLFSSMLFAQTTIFQDNFETGNANNWTLRGTWNVVKYNDNYVLSGDSSGWAEPIMKELPYDYTAEFKILIIQGNDYHISFKTTNVINGINRYYFSISRTSIILYKQIGTQFYNNLVIATTQIDLNTWYKVRYELTGNNIKVYLNDILMVNYTDQSNPIISGKALIAFENDAGSKVLYDDILIKANLPVQNISWIRTGGPLGGIGYDVRVDKNDPDLIYATDNWAGVHKSTDGGTTWIPKNQGITSRNGSTGDGIPIFCLTIDPNNSNILWCGTFAMRGVYRSADKGEHWEFRANGIPETNRLVFRSFCIQPGNSNVVYCGTEWSLFGNEIPAGQFTTSRGKIYKTIDGGLNWNEVLDSDALVRTIIIDPTNTDIVYAATGIFDRDNIKEEGIWKSTNAGQSWFHINTGITNKTIGHIEMHPNNSNILLAVAGRLWEFGGGDERGEILRTTNGGQTWTQQLGGVAGRPFSYVEFDENNINNVYAAAADRGFYKSTDGGLNWFQTTYNPPYYNPAHIISIATHKQKKDWVITNGYGGGVFLSTDGANTWKAQSYGYTGCEITGLALAQDDPLKIYAVARSSIFKSTNGGNIWNGIGNMTLSFNNIPIGPTEMRSVAVNPSNSKLVLTGANIGDMYRSTDEGQTWTKVFDNHTNLDVVNQIAYSSSNTNIVYAGMSMSRGISIDRPMPILPTAPSYGMLKSTDGGINWNFINNGLDPSDKNIMTIAVHPTNPQIVFIGTLNTGIYKTTDGGINWSSSSTGITVLDIRAIVFDHSNLQIMYAGIQRGGIFKSTDGGSSWRQINYGIDPEASIRSIVIDPTNSQIVYAGDWTSGVYRSTDAGNTWFHINSGLRTRAVQRLVISSNGKYLYAGTQGEGVFRLVSEQLPPQINSVAPDTTDTIQIVKGDSLAFSVSAFDINDAQLNYSWYLQNTLIPNTATSSYLFKTKTLSLGDYNILSTVSNVNGIRRINWKIIVVNPTSVELGNELPIKFELYQSYPNPFNPSTTIRYSLPRDSKVKIEVYSLIGQKIKTVLDEIQNAGFHEIIFNGQFLSSGVYFYQISAGEFISAKKFILIK